jgi:hypothetical protein
MTTIVQRNANADRSERLVGRLIWASSALFVLVLVLAAYWDPTIRVLHVFEAVPFLLAAFLSARNSKVGYALGVASGGFWLWLAGWVVTFVRRGFEVLAVLLRTGEMGRPDVLIAAPAAVASAALVIFSLVGYIRLRNKSWRDVGVFGAAFVAGPAFFVGMFAAFAPQFLTPLKHFINR